MFTKLTEKVRELVSRARDELLGAEGNEEPVTRGADGYVPDEERILQLLDQQNGTVWQSQVKRQLEWSASKTSRVLSSMEEGDLIARYRVGREKVVCLPGQEPDWLDDTWSEQYEN